MSTARLAPVAILLLLAGCAEGTDSRRPSHDGGSDPGPDTGTGLDASEPPADGGAPPDAAEVDAGPPGDGGSAGTTTCTSETADTDCGGGPCVDGYCCDAPCDGTCMACDLPGMEGTCTPQPAGSDPDDECAAEDPSTCSTTGECDGSGACALYGEETSCDDGQACTTDDTCDGSGSCQGEAPASCGPGPANECCVGGCVDGEGCTTMAADCPDLCELSTLTVGQTCAGCGAAGAEGVCAGGGVHRCDDTSHEACRTQECGGLTYYCTNRDGTWGWRTGIACDDGDLCTYDDRCVSGSCTGTAIDCASDECATRSCDGTSSCVVTPNDGDPCDDGDPCTYGDTCDASGSCVAGTSMTCDDSPCVARECDGVGGCTETLLTSGSCDDGDPCTYGESCDGSGSCGGGTAIDCDAMDGTCLDYSCNGTSSCDSTPINVGGACDDGDPDTDSDVCQSDGSCQGVAGCPPPSEACSTGSQDKDGCGGAKIIGRPAAASGFSEADDTCYGASDDFNESGGCFDAGDDHAYKLYMREGETADISVDESWPCSTDEFSWNITLSIYESASGCYDTGCATRAWCDDYRGSETHTYTAPQDGWITIVVDGSTAFDDEGDYTLHVTLSCNSAGCGC